jgi:hypothetical protein
MSSLEWRTDKGIVLSETCEAVVPIGKDGYLTISADPDDISKVPAALAALPEVRAQFDDLIAHGHPVVCVRDWCGDHKLNENSLASIDGSCHEPAEADDNLDLLKKELQRCKNAFCELRDAFYELQDENEILSLELELMKDEAASLAGIKP